MANYVPPLVAGKVDQPVRRGRNPWGRRLLWLLVALALVVVIYFGLLFPWMSHWGATGKEVQASLPGDDLVANSLMVTTKAVTVQAAPADIWPWLVQLGVDRGGMYSYLWVENWILRLNVENIHEIHPEWQTLQVGDFIRFTPEEYPLNPGPGLYVVSIEPEYALVGCFGMEGSAVDCNQSSTWQFVLQPLDENNMRLILRSHTSGTPSSMNVAAAKVGYAFQFFMEQKMLRVIRDRAEMVAVQQPLFSRHKQDN